MQAKATDGHPMVTAVVVRVIEFYSPRVRKIGVQKLGGLSPLSVTDRGESLLIFGNLFHRFGWGWGWGWGGWVGVGGGVVPQCIAHMCSRTGRDGVTLRKKGCAAALGQQFGVCCFAFFISSIEVSPCGWERPLGCVRLQVSQTYPIS